jgi:hypothetical protein
MPDNRYTCPDCNAVLRLAHPVPVGKKIKCPKCHATFPAGEEAVAVVKAAKSAKPASAPKPEAPPAVKAIDDDEEGGGQYGFAAADQPGEEDTSKKPKLHFGDLRDRFPKSKRGPAIERLVGPAKRLMYAGVTTFLAAMVWSVSSIWPMIFGETFPPVPQVIMCIVWLMVGLLGMGMAAVVVAGSTSISNLDSYAWGMTACIVGIITGIGTIFAIWCLVLLMNQDIKDAFEEEIMYRKGKVD